MQHAQGARSLTRAVEALDQPTISGGGNELRRSKLRGINGKAAIRSQQAAGNVPIAIQGILFARTRSAGYDQPTGYDRRARGGSARTPATARQG